jgi:Flp pilus assembly protein TadG
VRTLQLSAGDCDTKGVKSSRVAAGGSGGERGAEQLEFGFVFVVLMTLMMGIVVFSQGYHVYQSITRAAREGARMAVMPNAWYLGGNYLDGNVTQGTNQPVTGSQVFDGYIAPVLRSSNLNPNLVVNYSEKMGWLNPGAGDQQCGVIISFAYPYELNIPFTSLRLTTIDISTRVQMRRESQPLKGSKTCP